MCYITGISMEDEHDRGVLLARGEKPVNGVTIFTGNKDLFKLRNVLRILKFLIQFIRKVDKFALKESQYNKKNKIKCCDRYNSFHW